MMEYFLRKNLLPDAVERYSEAVYEDNSAAISQTNPDTEYKSLTWQDRKELIYRHLPNLQKLLGRTLYWLGVPIQILVLTRKSNLSLSIWLPPVITIASLLLGLVLCCFCLEVLKKLTQRRLFSSKVAKFLHGFYPRNRAERGSFMLASILGNTGFIGLAIVPAFVSKDYLVWVVLYGVAHNLIGSYGLGVVIASYFGRTQAQKTRWQTTRRDILFGPAFWALILGYATHDVDFPPLLDALLQAIVFLAVPGAFLLVWMQLSKLKSIQNIRGAIVPSAIKMLVLPALAGLAMTWMEFPHEGRLALVLMSGMPSAFANAILAEEYNLSRPVAASSIIISTVSLSLTIPLWLLLFR
jgi:hypothetical protein